MKRGKLIFSVLMFIILATAFVSAGLFDFSWFKKTITGKVTSQPTNVSISVVGINSVYFTIWNNTINGTDIVPTEEGTTTISFNVTVYDDDGLNDINDSSVMAEFINDSTTRANATCAPNGDTTPTSKNYTCSIDMWYFDVNDVWMINVTANDLGNTSYMSNYTQFFTYEQLQAIKIAPETLSWPAVSPGDTNKTSNNDPSTINNTGNYNATGYLQLEAINLYGTNGEFIASNNFTVGIDTGGDACTGDLCIECNSTTNFANGTSTTITVPIEFGNLTLEAGNLTAGYGNVSIYYCALEISSILSSQTYSTDNTGSSPWTIRIV